MDRNEVQKEAIKFVMEHEKMEGKNPELVTNVGYDIRSDNRQIEVKGRSGTDHFVLLNYKNVEALEREPNFWLYIVHFDRDENPRLIKLNKSQTEERRKERKQWEVPFWKKDLGD